MITEFIKVGKPHVKPNLQNNVKMEQETKKISFGFSKSAKKTNIIAKFPAKRDKIQLIDCLEAQTIKIKDAVKEVKGPLVIPLVESTGNILDRRREQKIKREAAAAGAVDDRPDSELTPDELAARELLRDVQNLAEKNETPKIYALPAIVENTIEIEGKEEPTIDDYESIPISEYGLAMLRGMGWKEGIGIGKNKGSVKIVEPTLRPKGMGLGANKGTNRELTEKPPVDKDGKELVLKKGSYAKIIDGKQKGSYCEVQGFDDEAGRIIVKTSLQGLILSLNEFLVKPVLKEEYMKLSKVINNAKFEEYKNKMEVTEAKSSISKQDQEQTSSSRHQPPSSGSGDSDNKYSRRKIQEDKRDKSESKKKSKKKHRSSSNSSVESQERRKDKERTRKSSPVSDNKKYKHKSDKKMKHRKHKYSDDSDSGGDRSRNKAVHRHGKQRHDKDRRSNR